jgi:hypothetical protein
MPAEAEKHIDDEMQYVVLRCECEIRDLIIVCFFEGMLFSVEWLTRGRQCRQGEVHHPSLLVLRLVSFRYT